MPTYRYRCTACGHEYEQWQSFDAEPLTRCSVSWAPWEPVEDYCQGHAVRVLGPVRTPSGLTKEIDATERTWDVDRPAYKRLRMEGMQPPHVDGAAKLEAVATNDLEVNTGLRYGKLPERQVKEAITEAQESGWVPTRKAV